MEKARLTREGYLVWVVFLVRRCLDLVPPLQEVSWRISSPHRSHQTWLWKGRDI